MVGDGGWSFDKKFRTHPICHICRPYDVLMASSRGGRGVLPAEVKFRKPVVPGEQGG